MAKAILVVLALVLGYLAYTATYMGEGKIAIGMGVAAAVCLWGAVSGSKKTAKSSK